jgi:hypothetical protein
MLFSYGLEFKDAKMATEQDRQIPLGPLLLPGDGALVKSPQDATVWLISQGVKYGFASASVYLGLGHKFTSVLTVTAPELNQVAAGGVLNDPAAKHLPGLHVNFSGTVYWLSATARHPYPSLEVYNSWNVDNDFSQTVPANAADANIPIGEIIPLRVIQ